MGWNILRRTPLIPAFFLWGVILNLPVFPNALPPGQGVPLTGQGEQEALAPRQHHAPSPVWGIHFESRPEIQFWLETWREELPRIDQAQERFFPFRTLVNRMIREADMPPEILWLPFVESAWRLDAVSSSGAAGPWQFLSNTALGRGIIIDTWRDERRDPWRSTQGALEELAFLYRSTNDWLLAMAAYNTGLTRLKKIQKETGIQDFWGLYEAGALPSQTRAYVPRILALALLASQGGREGLTVSWKSPPRWVRLPLTRSVSLKELSSIVSVDLPMLQKAHGELIYPFTPPPEKPYALKLPEETLPAAQNWLKTLEEEGAPRRFWRYTVVPGDSISQISQQTSIPLAQLRKYNGEGDVLRAGQRLFLPHDGKSPPPPKADTEELPQWTGRYTIMPGDTLWGLAKRFDTSPEMLAEANSRAAEAVLRAGSILIVPKEAE